MSYYSPYPVYFDPRFVPPGLINQFSYTGYFVPNPPIPEQTFGSLYVPQAIFVNDPTYIPIVLNPNPNPIQFIKHENGKLHYTPRNRETIIDCFNIIHAGNKYRILSKTNFREALDPVIKIIQELFKHGNSVIVVMHNKCLTLTKPITDEIIKKFPNDQDKLRIAVYKGTEENGDDLVCLKLAKKLGAIIISNDKMDKDEDRSFVPDSDIWEYTKTPIGLFIISDQ